jgi:hypothetical protein
MAQPNPDSCPPGPLPRKNIKNQNRSGPVIKRNIHERKNFTQGNCTFRIIDLLYLTKAFTLFFQQFFRLVRIIPHGGFWNCAGDRPFSNSVGTGRNGGRRCPVYFPCPFFARGFHWVPVCRNLEFFAGQSFAFRPIAIR